MKLNHGEWHEFAHILLLIFNSYYTVFEACRQYFDQVFFEENVCILQGDFVICNGKSFPREYFKKAADIILNAPGKGSYEIPQIIPFLNETEIRKFKAASNQKADVYLRLADRETIVGYSIKSLLAGNPTLINSSSHTNFIYEITGSRVDADMINGISGGSKVIKRIDAIYETSELKFVGVQSESMAYNMQIIDSNFANVLAEILLNRFLMKTKSIKDIISKTQRFKDAKVFITYGHDKNKADYFFEELNEEDKKKISFIKADLSSYEGMMKMVSELKNKTDCLDYLISNIGITSYAKFDDYTYEEWCRILNTNLSIPIFMIKELKEIITESILLTGSYAGEQPYSSSLVYSVSKAALLFAAKALVKELEPIRINAIAPGFIETPWQKDRSKESYEKINKKIALHRFGKPEEVAGIALSVLRNTYMNGSIVDIHGGYDYF